MKSVGKIDGFNSGPESDEKWWKIGGFNNGPESYENGWTIVGLCMLQQMMGSPGKMDGFKK